MSMYSPYGFGSIPYSLTRRKVFISYFHGDRASAQHFVNTFGSANGVFIPKALGLDFAGADRINSRDPDYVMDRIREKCIDDSSVQIVLVGPCTHSRRYIDWEIKRSLRSGNGLLGIHLPPGNPVYLPERFEANWSKDGMGYARFLAYPSGPEDLRSWIEEAYEAKTSRQHLRKNVNDAWSYNQKCKVCGTTH